MISSNYFMFWLIEVCKFLWHWPFLLSFHIWTLWNGDWMVHFKHTSLFTHQTLENKSRRSLIFHYVGSATLVLPLFQSQFPLVLMSNLLSCPPSPHLHTSRCTRTWASSFWRTAIDWTKSQTMRTWTSSLQSPWARPSAAAQTARPAPCSENHPQTCP